MNFLIPDDKKPTDADVVKALECCANLEACEKCPMGSIEKYDTDTCEHQIMLYALDLINRQKEYIKKCDNLERIADKTIETQKAEIEDIKFLYENLKEEHLEIIKAIKHTKSEAYKEFAERLKNEINVRTTFSKEQDKNVLIYINNLLKEMVGDEK